MQNRITSYCRLLQGKNAFKKIKQLLNERHSKADIHRSNDILMYLISPTFLQQQAGEVVSEMSGLMRNKAVRLVVIFAMDHRCMKCQGATTTRMMLDINTISAGMSRSNQEASWVCLDNRFRYRVLK